MAQDLHNGNTKPVDLNSSMILQTFNELKRGAKLGYGKDWAGYDAKEPNRTVLALQQNLYKFSGAKSYSMALEMQSKMTKDGKLRPYADFEKDVLEINKKYNRNYLQAEWQTARQAAGHVRNWERYQEDKDLFPNLKYKTAGDSRVRDDHAKLNNVVKPVDDPFWDKHYPPNGWRCRCYVVQTAEPAETRKVDDPDIKDEFRINVGKRNELISDAHPYFKVSVEAGVENIINRSIVRFANENAKTWAKRNLVQPNKPIRHEDLPKEVELTMRDVKTILGKPHNDRVERANLLTQIVDDFNEAEFLGSKPENKGREQYVRWYYFKSKSGNFYYNLVEMTSTGKIKLHAITDNYKE